MRKVVDHWSARRVGIALAAGSVALGAALVFAFSASDRVAPPEPSIRAASHKSGARPLHRGGETTISKLAEAAPTLEAEPAALPAEPTLEGLGGDIPWERPADRAALTPKPTTRVLAQTAQSTNALPWDAVEPVPFAATETTGSIAAAPKPGDPAAMLPAHRRAAPQGPLPPTGEVEGWVKAKATALKGENRGRPIYHFELWLDAPEEVKQRLVAVAYDFNTPAVMPQSQTSSEEKTGFRVAVGGLGCADNITVTLQFADGRKQQVAVDGCRLLG